MEVIYCVYDVIVLILFFLVRNVCNYLEMKYYY